MGSQYKQYFSHYFNNVKHLRRLQEETIEGLESIKKSKNLSKEHLLDLNFTNDELEEFKKTLSLPPCILVTGQSFFAKLIIITKIIGEQIIPVVNSQKKSEQTSYYSIRLRYGPERKVSVNKTFEKYLEDLVLEDLVLPAIRDNDSNSGCREVDIQLPIPLLENGLEILVTPTYSKDTPRSLSIRRSNEFLQRVSSAFFPVTLYAIARLTFLQEERAHLRALKDLKSHVSILFIRVPNLPESVDCDLPESEQQNLLCKFGILSFSESTNRRSSRRGRRDRRLPSGAKEVDSSSDEDESSEFHQIPESLLYTLCDKIGCLNRQCPPQKLYNRMKDGELLQYNDYIDGLDKEKKLKNFFSIALNGQLIKAANLLHESHSRCMRVFILYAFDMARETQITPRRIAYAKEKENELYENLTEIASKKQDEINAVIRESLSEVQSELMGSISEYQFKDVDLPENVEEITSKDLRLCTLEIQEHVLAALNEAVGRQLAQRLRLMRSSYMGTLRRCLETLEKDCRASGESTNVGDTLKQMMNAAYQLDISSSVSSSSLRSFLEVMKLFVTSIPGRNPLVIDDEWKKKMVQDVFDNLSESKLARVICTQLRDKLKFSHDSFVMSMKELELQLTSRLEQKEENHMKMKRLDAPRMARMSLESTSIRDKILYGMPVLEKEIGRGQYGVVFGCSRWGGFKPCAIKSLVPFDDKHWNDLAMEFHYTRSIPEHERIVSLRGSVIDYTYGQCDSPAVLLVMERLGRDLYSGIKKGLEWHQRLRIALDVTQGMRFLHSQGLVHRDIKLKNVLLDSQNRAKLTDLGFCKPEAMMSGSIVGTPIHMAPELFSGCYDNSVDVYAFGILFWYICAGHVKLPFIFDQCNSKDQLWLSVKKGARPERLNCFNDECWQLMSECWSGVPSDRPFLGNVEPRLEKMLDLASDATPSKENPTPTDGSEFLQQNIKHEQGQKQDPEHGEKKQDIEHGQEALSDI